MTRICTLILIASLVLPAGAFADDQSARTMDPREWWRQYAERLPARSEVIVHTSDGQRFNGVLSEVDETGIMVRLKTRIPEPARRVEFARLAVLELKTEGAGPGFAARLGVGTATGVGVFFGALLMLAIALRNE